MICLRGNPFSLLDEPLVPFYRDWQQREEAEEDKMQKHAENCVTPVEGKIDWLTHELTILVQPICEMQLI